MIKNEKISKLLKCDPIKEKIKEEETIKKDKKKGYDLLHFILSSRMKQLNDRSKCYDLFWKVKVDNLKMYK